MNAQHLTCAEMECQPRAYADPALLGDPRTLATMLQLEECYTTQAPYFKCVQTDLQEYMRKMVTMWMLEACEEQGCEEEVFPLAVNFLDRFLSLVNIDRSHLQLLAGTCMLVASKLRDTRPLEAHKVVEYTDNSISIQDLLQWEHFLLQQLRWDTAALVAHDFTEHLVQAAEAGAPGLSRDTLLVIRKHAHAFAALCLTECHFISCPPSALSAACLVTASQAFGFKAPVLAKKLAETIHADLELLSSWCEQVSRVVSVSLQPKGPSPPEIWQPLTPTDLEDIGWS